MQSSSSSSSSQSSQVIPSAITIESLQITLYTEVQSWDPVYHISYILYVYNTRRFHSNYSQSWPKPLHAPLLRSRSKSQVLSFQSPRVVNPAMKTRGPFFLFGTNKYSVNNHHIVNKTSLVGGFKTHVFFGKPHSNIIKNHWNMTFG